MRRKHGRDKIREEPDPPPRSQVVWIRTPGREAVVRRIKSLFQDEDVERWKGCFAVITENKIRIRHPEKPKDI